MQRVLRLFRRFGDRRYLGDKAVALAGNIFDEFWILCVVPERFSQRSDGDREAIVLDKGVCPDRIEEFLLAYGLARPLDKKP